MKKILYLLLPLFLASCSAVSFFDMKKGGSFAVAGEGSDVWSSSTNWSGKEGDTTPKADPTAGAGFIAPPQISNYGSVSFSYPVAVTPGRRFNPQISLSYSSSGSDGLAGVGWNVSNGLPSVTRSNPAGDIRYDATDTFSYNGRRLVKTSGGSGSADGIYRCEIESDFIKLECKDSASGGVWYAYDSSGAVTVLGEMSYERISSPDNAKNVYSWNFSRTYDLCGNTMFAVYDDEAYARDNVLYAKGIYYTSNTAAGSPAAQFVKFEYKDRDDPYVTKSAGFVMKLSRLITRIVIGWEDGGSEKELWDYTITYKMTADSNRPAIEKIASSRHSAEPSFSYQDAEHALVWKYPSNPWYGESEFLPGRTEFFEGDFNGDGVSDMVLFNHQNGQWKGAEGTSAGGYTFKTYGTKFAGYDGDDKIRFFKGNASGDYNGDGRSDIAFFLPETREFYVAEHTGTNFNFKKYGELSDWVGDIFAAEWFPGDYDGNGLSDALLYFEATGEWILMKNNGGSFSFVKFASAFKNLYRSDYTPDTSLNSALTADLSEHPAGKSKVNFLSGDFNGDGRSDIALYDSRSGNFYVSDLTRSGSSLSMTWKLYKKFTAGESALFANDRFSGDYNGDGYSDFLMFDRSTGQWIIGETGNDTITFRVYSVTPQFKEITRWLQGDFNGDGRTDIGFYSASDGCIWVGESTGQSFRYRIYNNFNSCPQARAVAENIPLPYDDVRASNGFGVVGRGATSAGATYNYDSNFDRGGGERIFPGYYANANGLMLFKNAAKRFYMLRSGGTETPIAQSIDISDASISLIAGERRIRVDDADDGVAFMRKSGSGDSESYVCGVQTAGGVRTIATIAKSAYGFTPTTMPNALGYSSGVLSLFVLDSEAEKLRIYLNNSETDLSLAGALPGGSLGMKVLHNGKILLYQRSGGKWYLGTLNGSQCEITSLSGSAPMPEQNADVITRDHSIVTVEKDASGVKFREVSVEGAAIATRVNAVDGATFNGAADSDGNPVVETADGLRRVNLRLDGYSLSTLSQTAAYTRNLPVYAYQWIQGDYNGDGKTDIGFYNLKARYWYYLVTTGTVPDLITKVENGIGGKYYFDYINSTSCDNRGDDGLPHLPMNYKLCSRMVAEDGSGNSVASSYEYKGGYAFSAYINGRKETDYFGFSEFTVRDDLGNQSITRYNTKPFADFLDNRALGGAVRESVFIGSDRKEYARTEYTYAILPFYENGITTRMSIATATKSYMQGVLSSTQESSVEKASGYGIAKRVERSTDGYSDSSHPAKTVTTITEFEQVAATNEQRIKRKISFAGSANELISIYGYDSRGLLTYEETDGVNGEKKIMRSEYDVFGNRTRSIDESGSPSRVTEYAYDKLNSFLVKESVLGPITLNTTYEINYDKGFGGAQKKTDANGNSVYYEFDDYGRLKTQYADTDSGKEKFADYVYEQNGFPLSVKVTQYDGKGLEKETKIYADGFGRVLGSVWSVDSDAGSGYAKSGKTTYDALGRVVRQGQPVWATSEDMNRYREADEVNATETQYDPAGRVLRVTYPLAEGETARTYTANEYPTPWTTITTESSGRTKKITKNGRGEILYVTDSGDDITATIGFAYDDAGNRIKKSDLNNGTTINETIDSSLFKPGVKDESGNNVCQWRYDGFGRVVESSDADLGYSKTEYTSFGEVKKKTDARGLTTEYVYDSIGRLLEKISPNNEGSTVYTYDGGSNGLGKVSSVHDANQQKDFYYDRLGRVTRELREVNGISTVFETKFTHDNLGRTRTILYPEDPSTGERVTAEYSYVAAGVKSIKLKQGVQYKWIVKNISYNELGQCDEVVRGNDTTTQYTYDEKQRLRSLSTTDAKANVIQNVTYGYFADNTIAWKQDETGEGDTYRKTRHDYTYDGLDRLETAKGEIYAGTAPDAARTYNQSFAYTLNGNITQNNSEQYGPSTTGAGNETVAVRKSYGYVNHAVTSITRNDGAQQEYRYDASGNMVYSKDANRTRTMSFNSDNRIVKVTGESESDVYGEYTYDEQGFRIRKIAKETLVEDQREDLIYPSMYFALERKIDPDGAEIEGTSFAVNNIYLNGVRIAAAHANGEAKYYLTDQVDSVSMVTDDTSAVETRTEYLPFGETWVQEGDTKNKPKFNSQELDEETGLYFYNARYYDGDIGRFVTADNVIDGQYDTQGWNRYAYVKNNPVTSKDPTGNWIVPVIIGIGAAVGFLMDFEYLNEGEPRDGSLNTSSGLSEGQKAGVEITGAIAGRLIPGAGSLVKNGLKKAAKKEVAKKLAEGVEAKAAKQALKAARKKSYTTANPSLTAPKEAGVPKSTIRANAEKGKAFEQKVKEAIRSKQDDVVEQITIKTKSGYRTKMDLVGKDKASGQIELTEAKASAEASLTKNQRMAHPEIEESGGVVVGKGKEPFVGGTVIPPTSVKIIRP